MSLMILRGKRTLTFLMRLRGGEDTHIFDEVEGEEDTRL